MKKYLGKKLFIAISFFIFSLLWILVVYKGKPEMPSHCLNSFLSQQLQSFYPDSTHSFFTEFQKPSLDKVGLTFSFDPLVILTDVRLSSISQAEKRFGEVFADYQSKLNSIPIIRPFLAEFPLTPNSIYLSVDFRSQDGKLWAPPDISSVSLQPWGSLDVTIFTPEIKDRYKTILSTPLDESELLKPFFQPFVERTFSSTQNTIIPELKIDKKTPPFLRSVFSFMESFSNEHHLFPLALHSVGEHYYDKITFGFALWGKERLEFDQAHRMAAECARDFLKFLRKDKDAVAFLKKRSTNSHDNDAATTPEPRHMTFRISLWDEGINRQPSPNIAEIRFSNSTFQYFTSDEGQRLVPVFQETFDEAMEFLEHGGGKVPLPLTESQNAFTNQVDIKKKPALYPCDLVSLQLDKELQNFHSNEEHAHPVRMWMPKLERTGLTYSFEPFEILTGVSCTSDSEGAEKFVEVFLDYQKKLNSIPYIRPFLAEFPLTPKSILLEVGLRNRANEPWAPPNFSSIILRPNGKLDFLFYTPEDQDVYKSFAAKPVAEIGAFRTLFHPFVERSSIPSQELKIVPFEKVQTAQAQKISMFSFVQAFSQQQNLVPLLLGDVGESVNENSLFSFAACGRQKIPFAAAHLMATQCAQKFLMFLRKDQDILSYMKHLSKDVYCKDPATIPEPRHFAFRISFWDEAINRQPSPFIAEIRYDQSVFKYFTSDEGQRLVLVHEESFDEAMKFLEKANKGDPKQR